MIRVLFWKPFTITLKTSDFIANTCYKISLLLLIFPNLIDWTGDILHPLLDWSSSGDPRPASSRSCYASQGQCKCSRWRDTRRESEWKGYSREGWWLDFISGLWCNEKQASSPGISDQGILETLPSCPCYCKTDQTGSKVTETFYGWESRESGRKNGRTAEGLCYSCRHLPGNWHLSHA